MAGNNSKKDPSKLEIFMELINEFNNLTADEQQIKLETMAGNGDLKSVQLYFGAFGRDDFLRLGLDVPIDKGILKFGRIHVLQWLIKENAFILTPEEVERYFEHLKIDEGEIEHQDKTLKARRQKCLELVNSVYKKKAKLEKLLIAQDKKPKKTEKNTVPNKTKSNKKNKTDKSNDSTKLVEKEVDLKADEPAVPNKTKNNKKNKTDKSNDSTKPVEKGVDLKADEPVVTNKTKNNKKNKTDKSNDSTKPVEKEVEPAVTNDEKPKKVPKAKKVNSKQQKTTGEKDKETWQTVGKKKGGKTVKGNHVNPGHG